MLLTPFNATFVHSSTELGLSNVGRLVIKTRDSEPVGDRPRRVPLHKWEVIKQKIKEMLDVGVIHPSGSPWSACPVLATKPDGSVRWCVDS